MPLVNNTVSLFGFLSSTHSLEGLSGLSHSVSQAWRIGRAIALCRSKNDIKGVPRAILELQNGACLFIGKIFNVQRVGYCSVGSVLS